MSVVCCRIYPDSIEIASDSIIVTGWTQSKSNNDYSKLIQVNGMTIGSVGVCSESSMFQIFCKTHRPKEADADSMLDFLSEFLDWKKKKTDSYELTNQYIIVYKSKAFLAYGFFVDEIKTYEAIGAGMDYALASLYLGNTVDKSVQVACELSVYCEMPVKKFVVKMGNANERNSN